MGKENSKIENNNEKTDVVQIIKNNIIYNIKLNLVKDEKAENIKITISFVINQNFYIYEEYFNPSFELKKPLDYQEIYQNLIEAIENEQSEIIHLDEDGNKYIILKIYIIDGIKSIKLKEVTSDDTLKLNELIKNYKSLEEKYIKLEKENEKEKENDSDSLKNNYDPDDYEPRIVIDDNNPENNTYENNEDTKYENSDENHILLDIYGKIWCMMTLNNINYIEINEKINLNLVAIGLSNDKIILINLSTMKIHQEIQTPNTVYSLAKFNDDPKYFIASFENGQMIIYKLNKDKYEQHQLLEKPEELKKDEINKVITLSDGNIATAERGAISIWKPNIELGEKKYEFFKEIITHDDTCQLLEVNPGVFACAIYQSKLINIYKNDGSEYPLIGNITNVESHGNNSNGMAKINDNIFCSGGQKCFLYIVSVVKVQIIQKISFNNNNNFKFIQFIHNSNDGFIFTSYGDGIFQYKIVTDNDGDFVKLEEFERIKDDWKNTAIITTNDGKILYRQYNGKMNKTNLFLTYYKKLDN